MNKTKILVVEDEQEIGHAIREQLQSQGYEVTYLDHGIKAITLIQEENQSFHLFILDRMLPGANGVEICQFVRKYNPTRNVPILFISALSSNEQIIEGLDAGADDYMTKPFDLNIFNARVRSLLRRQQENISTTNHSLIKWGEISMDLDRCELHINEQKVDLTISEFKLLAILIKGKGKVLTRKQLIDAIQDGPVHVTDRIIDTHIFGLRKKIGNASNLIETIRGVGYRVKHVD